VLTNRDHPYRGGTLGRKLSASTALSANAFLLSRIEKLIPGHFDSLSQFAYIAPMPRLSCKTPSLILCAAIAALSLQCSCASDRESLDNAAPGLVLPLLVNLDLGTGSTDDLLKGPPRFTSVGSASLLVPNVTIDPNRPFDEHSAGVIEHALSLVGVHYRRGGTKPESGLDCSGLVQLVFHDVTGLELPRRAVEISQVGQRVNRQDLRPGDLIFFNTVRRTISHVGIYLGDGQFIHAPASGGRVRVESIDLPYWVKHFSAARRIAE
jgi:hypothetical protein